MTLVGRSCAIFDVDGTLLDGFIMPAFTRYLADHTVIDVVYADAMDDLLIAYRDGHVTYEAVGEKAPRIYARALQDRQQRDVQTLAARFMRRYISENAFRYAQPLVRRVTDLVDITVALSGAHQATIDPLKNWGFNHVHGSELSVERDRYTGDITSNLVLGSGKIAHVEKLCNEYQLNLTQSMAFGDTAQDATLFHMVGLSVAINPNNALQAICATEGWRAFREDDLTQLDDIMEWLKGELTDTS